MSSGLGMDSEHILATQMHPMHSYGIGADGEGFEAFANAEQTPRSAFSTAGVVEPCRAGSVSQRRQQEAPSHTFTPISSSRLPQETADLNGSYKAVDTHPSSTTFASPKGITAGSLFGNIAQNFGGFTSHPLSAQQSFAHTGAYVAPRSSIAEGIPPYLLPPGTFQAPHFSHATPGQYDGNVHGYYPPSIRTTSLTPTGYGQHPGTPRHVPFPLLQHQGGITNMGSNAPSPNHSPSREDRIPWPDLEMIADVQCNGQSVTIEIEAKVDKGFFLAAQSPTEEKWTCYRRNYFAVTCHYSLLPYVPGARLYLNRNGTAEYIQALGIRLSAAVDGTNGKTIELIQYTPKRDNGAKITVPINKVYPQPPKQAQRPGNTSITGYAGPVSQYQQPRGPNGPNLPCQDLPDETPSPASEDSGPPPPATYAYTAASNTSPTGYQTSLTFERVQFKQATANNGKRRASQQYFHLIVELFADMRKDGETESNWVKVCQRVSAQIVVRGRSPSHYQGENQHGQGGRNGGTGGGGGGGGGANYTIAGQPYRSMIPEGTYQPGPSNYGTGHATGGAAYQQRNAYGITPPTDTEDSPDSSGLIAMGGGDGEAARQEYHYGGNNDAVMPLPLPQALPPPQRLPPVPTHPSWLPSYDTEPRHYAGKFVGHHTNALSDPHAASGGGSGKIDLFGDGEGIFARSPSPVLQQHALRDPMWLPSTPGM